MWGVRFRRHSTSQKIIIALFRHSAVVQIIYRFYIKYFFWLLLFYFLNTPASTLLIENMVKNPNEYWNFGQKLKFWSKIEILVNSCNFGQKLKLWSKTEILVNNRNFGQKLKFWPKKRKFSYQSHFLSSIIFFL